MFQEMRRKKQQISKAQCIQILKEATSGVLALACGDAYPYAVPLSYVFSDNCLYFHCARSGHKLNMLQKQNKASFCVIAQDHVVPEKLTTYYRSVIVFGHITEIKDLDEKQSAIRLLGEKYAPMLTNMQEEIDRCLSSLCMLKMHCDEISGKQAKECIENDD